MNARPKLSAARPEHDAAAKMEKELLYRARNNQLDFLRRVTTSIFSRAPSDDGQGEITALQDSQARMAKIIQQLPNSPERDQLLELHLAAAAAAGDIAQLVHEAQIAVSEAGYGLSSITEMLDKLEEERIDLGNLCALLSPLARQVNQSSDLLRGAL